MFFNFDYFGYFPAIVLVCWVPITFYLFRRFHPSRAGMISVVFGVLFLPTRATFDLPGMPPMNREGIAAVTVCCCILWKARNRLASARLGSGIDILMLLYIASFLGTVMTNRDMVVTAAGKVRLPPMQTYDAFADGIRAMIAYGLPFFIGRILMQRSRDLRDAMELLVLGGLLYVPFVFLELKMSPVAHTWVYGYDGSTVMFTQHVRGGGYRPVVFLGHGLLVGTFMFITTAAAGAFWAAGRKRLFKFKSSWVTLTLLVTLVLVKSSAAILYGVISLLVVKYLKVRGQLIFALVLVAIVLTYPSTRMMGVFPVDQLLEISEAVSGAERMESLQFRFDNEDLLSAHASERLLFGWGGFGRERIYDPASGRDISVQDGHWIIIFGQQGAVGLALFLLLHAWPVVSAARNIRRIRNVADQKLVAAWALILAINAVNMLPNTALASLPLFMAGSLMGFLRGLPREARARKLRELRQQRAERQVRAVPSEVPAAE